MRCHHFKQLHRKDKYTIIISCIVGGIALVFLCVGLALPTWYVGYDSTKHSIVVTTNYFFTCHLSVDETSTELLCISYSSYICNDTVPIGCQNATTLGCTNPASSAKLYQYLDAPITYISLEDLQRVRVSGATAIVDIIILTISICLMLAFSCCQLPLAFLYVSPIPLYVSDLFLIVSLVIGSLVIRYYHVGCSLFVTGTMINFIFTIVGAFTVGRLEARRNNIYPQPRAQIYETTEINDNIKWDASIPS